MIMLIVASSRVSSLPGTWGPSSTTAADYTTNEVREIIRLLREEPDCKDARLSFNFDGISLELWEKVLGKPTAEMNGMTKYKYVHLWTYSTNDGSVSIEVSLFKEGELPYIRVKDNGNGVGFNSNKPVDTESLKQNILAVRNHIDPEWKEREHQGELARQREHKERIKQRDLEYKSAKLLATELFRNAQLTPKFIFSKELGVDDVSIVPTEETKRLIEAIRSGKEQEDWKPLLRFLEIDFGTFQDSNLSVGADDKFTRSDIEQAHRNLLSSYKSHFGGFLVFAATKADISSATTFYSTGDSLHRTTGIERHLSKDGWLLAWHPFMNEALVASSKHTIDAFYDAQSEIDQKKAQIRQRKNLGEEIPNEDQLVRDIVHMKYIQLKQTVLKQQIAASDSKLGPASAVDQSMAGQASSEEQVKTALMDVARNDSAAVRTNKQDDAERIKMALNKRVSLTPPYPASYDGARRDRISIQFAAREIAQQAGLNYDFETSFKNTDPICRRWIYPKIRKQGCHDALSAILQPFGLKYRIENGAVILERR